MAYKQNFNSPTMLKMLGDLNKDGKMSSYETARQNAIEKSMANSPANQTNLQDGRYSSKELKKATADAARKRLEKEGIYTKGMNNDSVIRSAKTKRVYEEAKSEAKRSTFGPTGKEVVKSPANQTKKDISVGKEAMKGAMRGAAMALAEKSGQMDVAINPAIGAVNAGKAALREGLKAGIAARKAKVREDKKDAAPTKQTKKTPKYTGKITGVEKRKGKPGYTVSTTGSVDPKDVMRAAKTGAMPSRKKTQQKVKKTGPKKTLDGNVIKY